MCPQPFGEHSNIVPHWRTSRCTQFVEVRSVSTVSPRAERIQGNAEPLGYLFLVDEFREFHVFLIARSSTQCAHSPFAWCRDLSQSQSRVFVSVTSVLRTPTIRRSIIWSSPHIGSNRSPVLLLPNCSPCIVVPPKSISSGVVRCGTSLALDTGSRPSAALLHLLVS